jgi:hypothetical protein
MIAKTSRRKISSPERLMNRATMPTPPVTSHGRAPSRAHERVFGAMLARGAAMALLFLPIVAPAGAGESQSLAFGDTSIWDEFAGKAVNVRLCDEEQLTRAECERLAHDFVNRIGVEFVEPVAVAADQDDPKFAEVIPACLRGKTEEMFYITGQQMPEADAYGPYAIYKLDKAQQLALRRGKLLAIRGFRIEGVAPGEEFAWTIYRMIDESTCRHVLVDAYLHGGLDRRRLAKFADGVVHMRDQYFLYRIEQIEQGGDWFRVELARLEQYEDETSNVHYTVAFTVTP